MNQRTESSSFKCIALLYEENKGNTAIQCALGVIAALGTIVSLCAYFSYLPPLAGYCGLGSSLSVLISLILLRRYTSNELIRKINTIDSFEDLQIIANQVQTDISFFGFRMISVPNLSGSMTLDALALKAEDMASKKRFSYKEHERLSGEQFVEKVSKCFKECDKIIQNKNCFTRLFYTIDNPLLCLFYTATIESRWYDYADSWFDLNESNRPKECLYRWLA